MKLCLDEFNKRFVHQPQGYLDNKTNKMVYCPVDIGFKFTRDDCIGNTCRNCWNETIECMKFKENKNRL